MLYKWEIRCYNGRKFWKREHAQMEKTLLKSAYFFFFSFTCFFVGKAYLGFTEKKNIVCGACA